MQYCYHGVNVHPLVGLHTETYNLMVHVIRVENLPVLTLMKPYIESISFLDNAEIIYNPCAVPASQYLQYFDIFGVTVIQYCVRYWYSEILDSVLHRVRSDFMGPSSLFESVCVYNRYPS